MSSVIRGRRDVMARSLAKGGGGTPPARVCVTIRAAGRNRGDQRLVESTRCQAWESARQYDDMTALEAAPTAKRFSPSHLMLLTTSDAGNPHARFDERGGETERWSSRRERQRKTSLAVGAAGPVRHRALPRLYRGSPPRRVSGYLVQARWSIIRAPP